MPLSHLSRLPHVMPPLELPPWPESLPEDLRNIHPSGHAHVTQPSRYVHLLNGYADGLGLGLDGTVFDDVVELLFSTLGETPVEARSVIVDVMVIVLVRGVEKFSCSLSNCSNCGNCSSCGKV